MHRQFTLFLLLCSLNILKGNVIVETDSGKVSGKEVKSILPDEKYFSFLGIPFAQSPVGALRFKAPIPHEGWNEVLQAKKERKPCAQFNVPSHSHLTHGFCGDEDCLYLSIHTPKLPNNEELKLPVIVFVYNDNFKSSFNHSKDYSPDFFMKKEVIIVTINHRLGAFGFLAFGDTTLPGNHGLRDVILALEWVQRNIKFFGGDPSKVTLMGNKGGAVMADILLHSPKAKGLFHAVILQSGTSWSPMAFGKDPHEKAISLTENLEDKATNSKSVIERLADIPADKISLNELLCIHPDESRKYQRGILPFSPVLEPDHPDAIITKYPEDDQDPIEIPIMMGFNSRNSLEECAHFLSRPNFLTYIDRDFALLTPIRTGYRFELNDDVYFKAIDEIKQFYFEKGHVQMSKPGEYLSYSQDLNTFYPMDYALKAYVNQSKSSVFYYMFDFSGDLNYKKELLLKDAITLDGTWGASRGDELCYLFICNPIRKTYKKLLQEGDSDEIKVLETMVELYANFAKTGNPTTTGNLIWKPATKDNKEILVISEEPKMVTNLYEDNIKFWDDFIQKYKGLAQDGIVKDPIKDEL